MNDATSEILNALRRFVKALRDDSVTLEGRLGITGAQRFVLKTLAKAETLGINELAEKTFTHQSSVSLVVAKLEKRKLVKRSSGSHDARRTEVRLTAEGRKVLGDGTLLVQEKLQIGLRKLTSTQREQLACLLNLALEKSGVCEEEAPMFFEDRGPRIEIRRKIE